MNYLVKLRQRNKSLSRSWAQLDPADIWFERYDTDKVPPAKCTRASINKRLRHLRQHNKYRPLRPTTFVR